MDWNTHTSKQSRFGGKKMQKFQIRNSVREKISKPNKKKKSPPIGVSKRLLCVYSDVSVLCGNWLSYVAADRWDLIATTINSDYECLKLCSDDSIMTNKLPSDGVLWNYKDTRRRYWFYGLSLVCETWKTKTRFCHGWLLLPPLLLVAFHVFFHFFLFCIQAKTFGNLSHGSFFVVTTRLDGLEGNKRGKSVLALGAHKNCICASLMGITRLRFFVRMSRGTQLI